MRQQLTVKLRKSADGAARGGLSLHVMRTGEQRARGAKMAVSSPESGVPRSPVFPN